MKVDQGRTGAALSLSALFFSITSVMNALLLHCSSVTWLSIFPLISSVIVMRF